MPLLGPNCMGLVNHALRAGVTFLSEYARAPAAAGSIAIVSQSGALGYSLAQAWDRGLGVRYFFSCGNSADVDVADLVAAMAEDPEVRAIACLFEGAPSAARMLEAGERARRAGKPVIVFKLGTSADGAAAARSHTGSLAGSAVAWRALFDRAGFVTVEDFEALLAEYRDRMRQHRVQLTRMLMFFSTNAFIYEPTFLWEDERTVYHRRVYPAALLPQVPEHPANPQGRALVRELKGRIQDICSRNGASHLQVGKDYPYLASRKPETRALVENLKRLLDPDRLLNPGALGLPL